MIELPKEEIAAFCRKHHIAKLSVFGSALSDDFGPDSDVDFLVEFEPGHVPGYIGLAGMERELSAIIGRKADMRTAAELSKYFRDDVLAAAVLQYAR
jgi:predicted nucleotidyltransferase